MRSTYSYSACSRITGSGCLSAASAKSSLGRESSTRSSASPKSLDQAAGSPGDIARVGVPDGGLGLNGVGFLLRRGQLAGWNDALTNADDPITRSALRRRTARATAIFFNPWNR